MTDDEMNPNICPSALEEDGTLDRSKWDGAHKWDAGECSECGTRYDEPTFPCIVYYTQPDDERNAGVMMLPEATAEAAERYMKAQRWSYNDSCFIAVYPLNTLDDEAGNKYTITAAKK